jgi:hypothetical protein
VANGVHADVEAVGDVHLELDTGFVLILRDVFFCTDITEELD